MKKPFSICLLSSLTILICVAQASAQTDFDSFWKKFKTAVVNKDKQTAATMVHFPLESYEREETITTRNTKEFLRDYNGIFNYETDAAKCFEKNKPEKVSAREYSIGCPLKDNPPDDQTFVYEFKKMKAGWRLTAYYNANAATARIFSASGFAAGK